MTSANARRALPDEEYLRRARPPRRWLLVSGIAAILLLGLAVTLYLFVSSRQSMNATVTSYQAHDHSIVLTVEVTRPDANRALVCRLRALDRQRAVVGSRTVTVLAGQQRTTFTRTIETSNRPVAAEVESCRYR